METYANNFEGHSVKPSSFEYEGIFLENKVTHENIYH